MKLKYFHIVTLKLEKLSLTLLTPHCQITTKNVTIFLRLSKETVETLLYLSLSTLWDVIDGPQFSVVIKRSFITDESDLNAVERPRSQ